MYLVLPPNPTLIFHLSKTDSIELSNILKLLRGSVSEKRVFNKVIDIICSNIHSKKDLLLNSQHENSDLMIFSKLCLKQNLHIFIIIHQFLDEVLVLSDLPNKEYHSKPLKILL